MTDAYPLLIALALGALIGLERKLNDHNAGIHTHALVSLGAALFIVLGVKISASSEAARVASQVVMAVGFLCGSVIMRDGVQVRGLNTAVTIWCSCAIGALAGAGLYALAGMGAIIVTFANFILHLVEHSSGWFSKPTPQPGDKTDLPGK